MNSTNRTKLIRNFFWLSGDKVLVIANQLLVGAVVARYLGPAGLGVLAFATAIISLAGPIVNFGCDNVLIRDFSKDEDHGRLYWSAFLFRIFLGGLIALLICFLVLTNLIKTGNSTEAMVVIITSLPLTLRGFSVTPLLLKAKHLSKVFVIAQNLGLIFTSVTKLVLVYTKQPLIYFAIVSAAQIVLIFFSVQIAASYQKLIPRFRMPDLKTVRSIVFECWPLVLASLSVMIYMSLDLIMLRLIHGTVEAGIYSVATRMSTTWYFVPTALSTTMLPWLAKAYRNQDGYLTKLKKYFEFNALLGFASVGAGLLFFPTLLRLLFGPVFEASIPVFRLHIGGLLFVFLGTARSLHLNLAKLHRFSFYATTTGLAVNAVLNWLLIPDYHSMGAASATVVSQFVAALATTFLHRDLFDIAKLQCSTLFLSPFRAIPILRNIAKSGLKS